MSRFKTATGKELELVRVADPPATGAQAARRVREALQRTEGEIAVCFASGSTPLPTYLELVDDCRKGRISFARVQAFILDEYYDMGRSDRHSYRAFMKEHLFRHVDLPPMNAHFFNMDLRDPEKICRDYEDEIRRAGGMDLLILGIGTNGHIAFNEPGTPKELRTRLIELKEETRRSNARFFSSIDQVPRYAITQGVANILEARSIILIAAGAQKAEAIHQALCVPPDPQCPASYLQEHTGELVVVLDEEAASGL